VTQGIPTPDKASADAIRAQVDASCGFPRCDRLSGTLVSVVAVTCPCTKPNVPDPRCQFRTDADALPLQTVGGWAYPVVGDAKTMSGLTPQQRSSIVTLVESAATPVGQSAAAVKGAE